MDTACCAALWRIRFMIPQMCMLAVMFDLPTAEGHALLQEPPSRNLVAYGKTEFCPHCLQSGGPNTVSERGKEHWPSNDVPTSHGLCGDPVQGKQVEADWRDETYLKPTPVQRYYEAGAVVEFEIGVSTHHEGHYEFRLCDKPLDGTTLESREKGQECLNARVLLRAPLKESCPNTADADCQLIDESYPGRWYLPPANKGTPIAGSDWDDMQASKIPEVGEVHKMRYKIPDDLKCEHCTLQWYWSTGNTCVYDAGYFSFFEKMHDAGYPSTSWCRYCRPGASCSESCCGTQGNGNYAEEFWNCADVAVYPPGQGPTPAPPTPGSAPTPAPGPCTQLWGQCGGQGFTGYTCCVAGSMCNKQNDYYSQCVPGVETPRPTPRPTPAPAPGQPTPAPPPGSGGGVCTCAKNTPWDGSFGRFARGGASSFCSQNFGGNNPYVSAGGGAGAGGGWSGTGPCNSGQYSFTEMDGWKITVDKASAAGKNPYRAFAYMQLCNGKQYSECWTADKISLSFSFKTRGVGDIGAYVKLLFWTDAGNIVGLLPPGHQKGGGKLRLIAFPNDDYPNTWTHEGEVEDGKWYHLQIDFTPANKAVAISLDGTKLGEGSIPVNMLQANNGPQIGVYSFDNSNMAWPDGFDLWLDDMCVGQASGTCPSGGGDGGPAPTPPVTARPTPMPTPRPTPKPPLAPRPTPVPVPTPPSSGCAKLCGLVNLTASGVTCGSQQNQGDCEAGYITRDSLAMPCTWTGCSCLANGADIMDCTSMSDLCGSEPEPEPETEPEPEPEPAPVPWDGDQMKMTHYWDCNGQGCDAATLQPWNLNKYISPPGYGPQDPMDFGGPLYGEKMWLTGAASDALSQLMGDDDGCCGGDPNDGGVGGCGKCLLVQNPISMHPDWTAVVMKKNRCPPSSHGCDAGKPHLDIAAPGYDNLQYSTANICGGRPGTGFDSKQQSATLGSWYNQCTDTAMCAHLCDQLPVAFRKGCRLFSSWGWKRGDPGTVKYRAVPCPPEFQKHVGAQFGADGAVPAPVPTPPVVTPRPTPLPMTLPTPRPTPAPTPAPTAMTTPLPTPAPTPEPTTPMSSVCKTYCSKTNVVLTALKKCNKIKSETECLGSYMYKTSFNEGKVTPCILNKKNKCRPQTKNGINCPGFPGGCSAAFFETRSHMATAKAVDEAKNLLPLAPSAHSHGFLSPRFSSSHVTLSSWFLQNQSQFAKHAFYHETEAFSEEL